MNLHELAANIPHANVPLYVYTPINGQSPYGLAIEHWLEWHPDWEGPRWMTLWEAPETRERFILRATEWKGRGGRPSAQHDLRGWFAGERHAPTERGTIAQTLEDVIANGVTIG